jgi:hypothetical protein
MIYVTAFCPLALANRDDTEDKDPIEMENSTSKLPRRKLTAE